MTTQTTITKTTTTRGDWEMIAEAARSASENLNGSTVAVELNDIAEYIEGAVNGVIYFRPTANVTLKFDAAEVELLNKFGLID